MTQSFYFQIDNTWPQLQHTQLYVSKFNNIDDIMFSLNQIIRSVSIKHQNNNDFYRDRLIIISCMELLIKNQDVCYGSLRLENVVKSIIRIMTQFKELELYVSNFSLTFDQIYQQKYQARKKYIEFILTNGFGIDIAEYILTFY